MYLENSEQIEVSGEGEHSREAMLAEKVAKSTEPADLSSPSEGNAELGMEALVECIEQTVISRGIQASIFCVECCKMNSDKTKSCLYCRGLCKSSEQYSTASNGFFEPDNIVERCETPGLSQPSDECGKHCECFKQCKPSEHCANHSLPSKCSSCCEHCSEHLRLFQQYKPAHQQFELAVNSDSLVQCEMSDFIPEYERIQQDEPSDEQRDCFGCRPVTSTEDSEQCSMSGVTPDISDSEDLLDCRSGLSECDKIQKRTECTHEEESYTPEHKNGQNERVLTDERSNSSTFDNLAHAYFTDDGDVPFATEFFETNQLSEDYLSTDHCEMCETDYAEMTQESSQQCTSLEHCHSERTSEFFPEEDCSSDCSSVETKSFKTCPEGSIPSDPCSDSSEESEKGAPEDSSDDQTQWESFEDDDEIEQILGRNEDYMKRKPMLAFVIEDYFDLFDRSDYYGRMFAQKRNYISCFDGGDIHDRLYLEEVLDKNANNHNEINEKLNDAETEEASLREDASSGSSVSEKQPNDWILESESNLIENEVEERESESHAENYEEAEKDEEAFDGKYCATDSEICEEVFMSSPDGENMCAPCADDISVEGDAYEDEVFDDQVYESFDETIFPTGHLQTTCYEEEDPEEFTVCSEMEPYWSLVELERNEELCEPGVEDYYAYHMKSSQSSLKQDINGYIMEDRSFGNVNENGQERRSERGETDIQTHTQWSPAEGKAVTIGITEVHDAVENLSNCSAVEIPTNGHTLESGNDSGLNDVSKAFNFPSDIIHSVVSELAKNEESSVDENSTSEQSRDSEDEQSDDESFDSCECEYCIPPTEQASDKPLLPRMNSDDAGKICVVIDLDETLVHSSFKPVSNADFIIPVEIDGTVHQVYVLKRPHVDEFLKRMGELFECVLFTASLSKYADPVSDLLDKWGAFRSRLFRESCVFHKGNYVKDLSRLGRDLNKVIIIDNSPASYIFNPDNAVPVVSWFDDMSDKELLDLIPFFERLSKVDDIYDFLTQQSTPS